VELDNPGLQSNIEIRIYELEDFVSVDIYIVTLHMETGYDTKDEEKKFDTWEEAEKWLDEYLKEKVNDKWGIVDV
jgi:hypothetical protein